MMGVLLCLLFEKTLQFFWIVRFKIAAEICGVCIFIPDLFFAQLTNNVVHILWLSFVVWFKIFKAFSILSAKEFQIGHQS